MKTAEKWSISEGKLIHEKTFSHNQTLALTETLRQREATGFSENKLVGVVDSGLIAAWTKEAGIRGSDPDYWEKLKTIIKRKMLDGEFAKLRVWQGNY